MCLSRNNGQQKKITEPGSITNTFSYDSYGRPETLTKTDGVWSDVTEWDYDAYGRVNKQTLGNGTWEDYTYDARSRLDSVTVKKTGPTTLHSQSMVYDEMGNMVSRTENGITTDFAYDFMDRLVQEDRNPSGTSNDYHAEYTYDENGNRLTRDVAVAGGSNVATAYTYDDADKLLSYTKGGTGYSYTYDDAGRPTSVPVVGSSNRTLVWDYDSHLKTWSAQGGGSAIFTNNYNGAGTRVSSVVAGGNTQVDLRAGVGQTAPLLKSDNSSVSDVNYVPGISEKRGSTWTWNHSGLKNVDAQTQASPSATSATRTYDAYGNVVTSTGSHVGPFGYGGKFGYQEDSVGYKLLGDRWYDPEVGRFLTRDRAHDGGNWYVYCENNPLVRVDEGGLDWHDPAVVNVDPRFEGTVIAVGERGPNGDIIAISIPPGYHSPPLMDVDYIIVIMPNGGMHYYFLMGTGYLNDKWENGKRIRVDENEVFNVDANGGVSGSIVTEFTPRGPGCGSANGRCWQDIIFDAMKDLNGDKKRRPVRGKFQG